MNKSEQAVVLLYQFSLGVTTPVSNLLFLEKGADLETLPLLHLILSAVILVFSVPSGVLADRMGRKNVFVLSCGMSAIALTVLLWAQSYPLLIVSIVFNAIGLALASSSLNAGVIDSAVARHGRDVLPKVSAKIAVLEGAGLSFGSVFGGFIAQAVTKNVNIILRLAFILIAALAARLCLKKTINTEERASSLRGHIRAFVQAVFSEKCFAYVMFGVFFAGMFLVGIETYWQPALIAVLPPEQAWLLGFIPFIGFSAVMLGSVIAQKILTKRPASTLKVFVVARALLSVFLILFAHQTNAGAFVGSYSLIYLFLGISNVAEGTVINRYAPSAMRASILSVYSFISRGGSMAASAGSGLLIASFGFAGIWTLMGIITLSYCLISKAILRKQTCCNKI